MSTNLLTTSALTQYSLPTSRSSSRMIDFSVVCKATLTAYQMIQIRYFSSSSYAICFGHCGASFVAPINVVIWAVTGTLVTVCCARVRVRVFFFWWRCVVRAHIIDCNKASAVRRPGQVERLASLGCWTRTSKKRTRLVTLGLRDTSRLARLSIIQVVT